MGTLSIRQFGIVALLAVMAALPCFAGSATLPATQGSQRAAIISLTGVIDDYGRDALFKRFADARKLGANVIILKLNTPGGLVTSGLDISRFLKLQDDLHIVAFVDEKAYSAGIMVGLACDEIVMEPGSYIGDSAPIAMDSSGGLQKIEGAERAKMESPILADFHDSAIKNGYDPLLAEAMVSYGRVVHWIEFVGTTPTTALSAPVASGAKSVGSASADRLLDARNNRSAEADPTNAQPRKRRFVNAEQFAKLSQEGWREVEEDGVPRPIDSDGTLLTVSAEVAHKIGLAKEIVSSPAALATDRGYTIVADLAPGGGEKLIGLLSSAAIRGFLLTIFMFSLYIALYTPGAGGAEAVAMITLGVLVGVPLLTGFAQWWEIALIVLGLILLALEIFVIPGFGVAGISGIALLLGGVVLTFVGNTPGLPGTWQLPQVWTGVKNGLLAVVVAFAITGFLAIWLRKYLPKLPYLNRLVLQPELAGGPTIQNADSADIWPFVGTIGVAVTDLKPGGSAEFPFGDDRRTTPVVSDSGFVSAGSKLSVREVHGNRVVVRSIS